VNFLGWYRDGTEIDKAIEDAKIFYYNEYKGKAKEEWVEFEYINDFTKKHKNLLERLGY